ncbi:hypothetical protein Tco_0870197 [Tanacetum coccineum]
MSPRTTATPDWMGNFMSEWTVEATAPSCLIPGRPNITLVRGAVIIPSGHDTWPAKPTNGDVGAQIDAFASLLSCWKQCLYIISVELPPST